MHRRPEFAGSTELSHQRQGTKDFLALAQAKLDEKMPEWEALDMVPTEEIGELSNYDHPKLLPDGVEAKRNGSHEVFWTEPRRAQVAVTTDAE